MNFVTKQNSPSFNNVNGKCLFYVHYYCLLMCFTSWMGFQSEASGDTKAATGKEMCSTKCKGVRIT